MTLRKELTIGEKAAAASRAAVASSAAKLEAAEKKVDELEARIVALTKEQKQLEADCTTWKVCRVCLCFDWMLFRRKQNKTDDLFVFVSVSVEWFPSRCRRALVRHNDGAPLFVLHSPQPRHTSTSFRVRATLAPRAVTFFRAALVSLSMRRTTRRRTISLRSRPRNMPRWLRRRPRQRRRSRRQRSR